MSGRYFPLGSICFFAYGQTQDPSQVEEPMQFRNLLQSGVRNSGFAAALFATIVNPIAPSSLNAQTRRTSTASPIKHVIVILGENRTFDHIFATYVPKQGETVSNLLSKGIVNADGTPGPNYYLADQYKTNEPITYS